MTIPVVAGHDVPVSRYLGAADSPTAVRAAAPGWRDPRLWIGVVIVAASVVLGARLVGAADDSVAVWAAADDLGAGDELAADDLVVQRVRFVDGADLQHYFEADEALPTDLQVVRAVGEGELVPRAAVGTAEESEAMSLPVAVDASLVPPGVRSGWVVDVYLTGRTEDGAPVVGGGRPVLTEVTVIDAPALEEGFAVSGQRQVVLAVTDDEAARFFRATGVVDTPVLTVVRRS